MLELSADLGRRARGLTADRKQKISLGRGLVRSDVAAILFDEPLTVIDPQLKWLLRRKLKQIHERFRLSLIYVTHDQNEALTFAEQVAVMYDGRVMQLGTPQQLFEVPAHTFVGYFIGSPGMNFLPCRFEGGAAVVDDVSIPLARSVIEHAPHRGVPLEIGIRPEHLRVGASPANGALPAEIALVEDLGNFKIVTARLGRHQVKAKLHEDAPVPAERGWLTFPPDRTRLYADGRLVA